MDPTRQQRDLNRGFGDALARAFEFAGALGIFVFGGWLLDRWLGTAPVITIALAVFCLVGQFLRYWYAYEASMRLQESEFWERRR